MKSICRGKLLCFSALSHIQYENLCRNIIIRKSFVLRKWSIFQRFPGLLERIPHNVLPFHSRDLSIRFMFLAPLESFFFRMSSAEKKRLRYQNKQRINLSANTKPFGLCKTAPENFWNFSTPFIEFKLFYDPLLGINNEPKTCEQCQNQVLCVFPFNSHNLHLIFLCFSPPPPSLTVVYKNSIIFNYFCSLTRFFIQRDFHRSTLAKEASK